MVQLVLWCLRNPLSIVGEIYATLHLILNKRYDLLILHIKLLITEPGNSFAQGALFRSFEIWDVFENKLSFIRDISDFHARPIKRYSHREHTLTYD